MQSPEQPEQPCQSGEVRINTPLGSIATRGKKTSDIVSVFCLATLLVLAYIVWEHHSDARAERIERQRQQETLAGGLRDMASAQRLMACLISLPQERREQEFRSSTGMCKQVERMQ